MGNLSQVRGTGKLFTSKGGWGELGNSSQVRVMGNLSQVRGTGKLFTGKDGWGKLGNSSQVRGTWKLITGKSG